MTDEELNKKTDDILARMSRKEKAALCSGADFWHTKAFERYEIPSITMSDGPNGLRREMDTAEGNAAAGSGSPQAAGGVSSSGGPGPKQTAPATCFPTAVTAAQTWNRHLIYEEGRAIGEEAKEAGVNVVLGPGVNIKRNPLCGRNFEYYSEDPYVSGELGAAFVSGMQIETGVGACLKHYACNSQEYCRLQSDSQMDERTLREIYLRAFEKVVKKSQPAMVMCAYNRVNGTYCSDSRHLLTEILRQEWNYGGAVVTDWGALNDRTAAFQAGCDLIMPGGSAYGEKAALRAVSKGDLTEEEIDICARRVLALVLRRSAALDKAHGYSYDRTAHRTTARRIAEEGAVLLKNNARALPIGDERDVVLIGAMAADMRCRGGGSSHVNAERLRQVRECMPQAAFVEGCDTKGNVTEESLLSVTRAAAKAKKAVVFVGLPESYESEGYDRADLSIPAGHNRMVRAALDGNAQTIVVLMGGSPMKLPWLEDVAAVLYTGLCGQEGGEAIARILTGKVNPSGRLTETWPLEEYDIPSYGFYADGRDAQYREGIYVGYRYYDKAGRRVRFPFGYGLSYTEFAYTGLAIDGMQVRVRVRNIGMVKGSEVVQLYVGNPQNGIFRPLKELRAFEKVTLEPLEEISVLFQLAERDFAVYQDGWKVPSGTYTIMVGASAEDIRLSQEIEVSGEDLTVPVEFAAAGYAAAGSAGAAGVNAAAGNTAVAGITGEAGSGIAAGADTAPGNAAAGTAMGIEPMTASAAVPGNAAAGTAAAAGNAAAGITEEAGSGIAAITASAAAPGNAAAPMPAVPLPGSWYVHPTGQPPLSEWRALMGGTVPEPSGAGARFDMNSSIMDMAPYSRINRRVLHIMEQYCEKNLGGKDSPQYRMSILTSAGGPLRCLKMFTPALPGWILRFLLWRGNRGRGMR